ncbi:MAG: prenyltransferase/squalene oxidase repeat-containing protein, partial [Phycisphaerae bacterium]
MTRHIRRCCGVTLLASSFFLGAVARGEPAPTTRPALDPLLQKRTRKSIDRGLAFLKSRQNREGGWTDEFGPAVTAIVAKAFAQDPTYGPRHPIVRRAVANILRYEQTDGGIYERRQNLANYQTSIVLMFLSTLHDPAHAGRIAKAQAFLTRLQFDAGESIDTDNPWYGGAGYNQTKRPDLSNTQLMLEALHQSGLAPDDPVYKRALKFVSRCQLNEATNDLPLARGFTDGGFIYSTNAGGESKASEKLQEGRAPLRSYGSMTYAGFKSMLYAGLTRDD